MANLSLKKNKRIYLFFSILVLSNVLLWLQMTTRQTEKSDRKRVQKNKNKKNDFNFTECLWNRSIMRVYVSVCVCVVKKATKILFGWFIIDGHYWRHHFNVCVCLESGVSYTLVRVFRSFAILI